MPRNKEEAIELAKSRGWESWVESFLMLNEYEKDYILGLEEAFEGGFPLNHSDFSSGYMDGYNDFDDVIILIGRWDTGSGRIIDLRNTPLSKYSKYWGYTQGFVEV